MNEDIIILNEIIREGIKKICIDAGKQYDTKFNNDEELNKLTDKINKAIPKKTGQKKGIEIMQRMVIEENSRT